MGFEGGAGQRGVGEYDGTFEDDARADFAAAADGGWADDDGIGADLDIVADGDGAGEVGAAVDLYVFADPDALTLIDEVAGAGEPLGLEAENQLVELEDVLADAEA